MSSPQPIAVLVLFAASRCFGQEGCGEPSATGTRLASAARRRRSRWPTSCVYGGTPGGVGAAIGASLGPGKRAVLVVFRQARRRWHDVKRSHHATDIGRAEAIGGMATEFYRRGSDMAPRSFRPIEGGVLEVSPRHPERKRICPSSSEHRPQVDHQDGHPDHVADDRGRRRLQGKDLRRLPLLRGRPSSRWPASPSTSAGRGTRSTARSINGVQFHKGHSFTVATDPYKIEGDPKSGLLWEHLVGREPSYDGRARCGTAVQASITSCMFILGREGSAAASRSRPITIATATCSLLRYIKLNPENCRSSSRTATATTRGPSRPTMIGVQLRPGEARLRHPREDLLQDHVNYQQGFDVVPPERPRGTAQDPGRAQAARPCNHDEFPETGGWPHELCVREGRHDLRLRADDAGGVSEQEGGRRSRSAWRATTWTRRTASGSSSRHVRRTKGDVRDRLPELRIAVSYRSIVPKEAECTNLFVPVCLSSSLHRVRLDPRMEPVFMILRPARRGRRAAMAIDGGISVQEKVEYAKLKEKLLAINQVLEYKGPKREAPSARIDPKSVEGIVVDDPGGEGDRRLDVRPRRSARSPAMPAICTIIKEGQGTKERQVRAQCLPTDGDVRRLPRWRRERESGDERARSRSATRTAS